MLGREKRALMPSGLRQVREDHGLGLMSQDVAHQSIAVVSLGLAPIQHDDGLCKCLASPFSSSLTMTSHCRDKPRARSQYVGRLSTHQRFGSTTWGF